MARNDSPLGKRWTDIGSDVNWSAYGGLWARHIEGTRYAVIAFYNDGSDGYCCAVSEVDTTDDRLDAARQCCGIAADWCDEYGDPLPAFSKVEALHLYGARDVAWEHRSKNSWKLIRAAKRFADG